MEQEPIFDPVDCQSEVKMKLGRKKVLIADQILFFHVCVADETSPNERVTLKRKERW